MWQFALPHGRRRGSIVNTASGFVFCWRRCLQNVKIYPLAKFGRQGSIHGWDIVTSVWEKQISAILKFYFRFRFRPYCRNPHDILHKSVCQISSISEHPMRKYHVISIFQDGGRGGSMLLPLSCLLMSLSSEGQNLSAKFRLHISIQGWNTTTPVLEKQTSAILEFYFRFQFWLHHRNQHLILHHAAQFHLNRSTRRRNMTSYRFFNMAAAVAHTTSGSYLLMSLSSEGQNHSANQISSI